MTIAASTQYVYLTSSLSDVRDSCSPFQGPSDDYDESSACRERQTSRLHEGVASRYSLPPRRYWESFSGILLTDKSHLRRISPRGALAV